MSIEVSTRPYETQSPGPVGGPILQGTLHRSREKHTYIAIECRMPEPSDTPLDRRGTDLVMTIRSVKKKTDC